MIYSDSNLVVQQTMKASDATKENMIVYHDLYNAMEGNFNVYEIRHIGRESNEEADVLANLGSTRAQVPLNTFLEKIEH